MSENVFMKYKSDIYGMLLVTVGHELGHIYYRGTISYEKRLRKIKKD
ncbi:hypothetical protein EDD76_11322 [Kineothrix alysoides]|uniref:Uncharacterized protein n=1 Tax=Kineothrix alysoides TaxID=1469948 RepID=A0A4R1QQ57_9FIRM|nr:hypothetical protein EDD76_11322 [Kineothrix alysoides]